MKYLFTLLAAFVMFCFVQAQERYILNQYNVNPALINPGANGFDGTHNVWATYRASWATFTGGPKTYGVHYNGPIADRLGLGAMILSDNYASLNATRGIVSFSYIVDAESYKIGAGLSAEILQYRLRNINLGNPLLDNTDATLLGRLDDSQFFDASLGVHGVLKSGLSFDLVFPGLVSAAISSSNVVEREAMFNYLFGLAYEFDVKDYDFKIRPGICVQKYRNVPIYFDVNVLMEFLEGKLRSGVMYRVGADNSLGFLIGTKISNLNFNYSYNVSFNPIQTYNNGGHEISLGLTLGEKK